MVKPKKHLGQHFLTDHNIARKIVSFMSDDYDTLCELGPGKGILTEALLDKASVKNLKLVEIDRESVAYLNQNFHDERLQIVEADFLKFPVTELHDQPFGLIGNFPYNISSQIFFKVLENRNLITEVVGMIQKEVGERIAAKPHNKTYGILSVLLQSWFDIEYCFTVHEHVFYPPPRVKSAVIRLKRNKTTSLDCDEALFFRIVKTAFNQRRKTLRNALKPICNMEVSDHPFLSQRAEQLDIAQFVSLTQHISQSGLLTD